MIAIAASLALATNFVVRFTLNEVGRNEVIVLGLITSIVGLFWILFDRFFWKWKIFRWLGLADVPDISGTWVGDVDRIGEISPHEFEMKVFQTYSKISIQTNTANSKSNSIYTSFLVDETGKNFDLINYWLCKTKHSSPDIKNMEDFKGISHIDIREIDGEIVIEDYYFTDRNPPTQGKARLLRRHI